MVGVEPAGTPAVAETTMPGVKPGRKVVGMFWMPRAGLEPAPPKRRLAPEASASANSATSAKDGSCSRGIRQSQYAGFYFFGDDFAEIKSRGAGHSYGKCRFFACAIRAGIRQFVSLFVSIVWAHTCHAVAIAGPAGCMPVPSTD